MDPTRAVLIVTHVGRARAVEVAGELITGFSDAGLTVLVPDDELDVIREHSPALAVVAAATIDDVPATVEIIVVVGGDGTVLRAAEFAVAAGVPLLGVNLGHVGFLAEAETDDVPAVVAGVVGRTYGVEERLSLDVVVTRDGTPSWSTWALNEASVEKVERTRMLDLMLEIAGHPLSRWGCDGVVLATPTGSTAYAWSVGGPVVWPGVRALIVAPISAHALFARPLVVDPANVVAVELQGASPEAVLWCDGRRSCVVRSGDRIEVTAGSQPIRFARMHRADFTDRLVAKFHLPVSGWREGTEL